jgi:hypothetical protein
MDKVQTIHSRKKIQIVGVASGGGAKDERCAQGPLALRDYGLFSLAGLACRGCMERHDLRGHTRR